MIIFKCYLTIIFNYKCFSLLTKRKKQSNVVSDSNDENNFPHKLLSTNTQVLRLRKAFANNSSANTKLPRTRLHKIEHSGEFSGTFLRPFLKPGLLFMKNVLKTSKSVLLALGLTAAASATDEAIY